jgi:hypothetical protein
MLRLKALKHFLLCYVEWSERSLVIRVQTSHQSYPRFFASLRMTKLHSFDAPSL